MPLSTFDCSMCQHENYSTSGRGEGLLSHWDHLLRSVTTHQDVKVNVTLNGAHDLHGSQLGLLECARWLSKVPRSGMMSYLGSAHPAQWGQIAQTFGTTASKSADRVGLPLSSTIFHMSVPARRRHAVPGNIKMAWLMPPHMPFNLAHRGNIELSRSKR